MMIKKDNLKHIFQKGLICAMFNWILLLALALFFYLNPFPECETGLQKIHLCAFCISHLFVVALIPIILIYIPLNYLVPNHQTHIDIACAIVCTLCLISLIVDAYVFYLYKFHLNGTVFEQLFGPGAGQVFELSLQLYVIAAVILIALTLLEFLFFRLSSKIQRKYGDHLFYFSSALMFVFVCSQMVYAVKNIEGDRRYTVVAKYMPACVPLDINGIAHHIWKDVAEIATVKQKGFKYDYPHKEIEDAPTSKNIVWIVLDSWTFESLSGDNCPNIYQFGKKSSVFTHHYSGGNCTRNGFFSMMYGVPGIYWYDFMRDHTEPVLIKEMEKNNYEIKLFPSASLRNPAFDQNMFYSFQDQCGSAKGQKAWERDENLTKAFCEFLNERDKNKSFFALLFFDSLHSMILPENNDKYTPTWTYPNYVALTNDMDPTPFVNLYKNMLFYIDKMVGSALEKLESENLMENTVIIVTGDHGQEFNETHHNFWGHNGNFSAYQVQTPFIYFDASLTPATYTHWSSHRDIVPTLMQSVFGVKNRTADYSIGRNLFDTTPRDRMMVDGYNGFATIEKDGTINNYYYDGTWDIKNSHMDELNEKSFDQEAFGFACKQIESFYKK